MADYFNIGSLKPNWEGPAGLAGMMAANQEQQYNKAVGLQQFLNAMQAETYQLNAPQRAAEREANTSGANVKNAINQGYLANPNYVPAKVQGDIGLFQSQAAKGQEDIGTVQGKINVANTGNAIQTLANQVRDLQIRSGGSPILAQATWRDTWSKLPPDLKTQLPPNWTPGVAAKVNDMYQQVVQSPEYMREQGLQQTKEAGMTQRTRIEQGAATGRKEAELAAARTPEQTLNWAREQLSKETNPDKRRQYYSQIDASNLALAENDVSKEFKALDPQGMFLLQIQAQALAKQYNLSPEDTQAYIKNAVTQYQQRRNARLQELLMNRGVTVDFLRRNTSQQGLDDQELIKRAKAKGIHVIE